MKSRPNNDINKLTVSFKEKVKLFLSECHNQGYNIGVYEAFRPITRQIELYNQGRLTPGQIVTWTLKSKHLEGKAIDVIFYDTKGNITWNGPYEKIIAIARKFGMDSLAPLEMGHFQDNDKPLQHNPTTNMEDQYTVIHDNLLGSTGFKPLFDNFDNDKNTKQLIDIAFARYHQRQLSGNKV